MTSANIPRVGKVALVGAGPGDPDLLTLKAVKALRTADVILIDDLVNRAVLTHARSEARTIEVGKRGGCQSTAQAFIERLMIAQARAGNYVVRLKGGDPFIFGRGGEELAALRRAGIAVEVVNGITAGVAAPAALGLSLTHRDVCAGVVFITGHTRDDAPLQWAALVASGLTLVVYMGVTNLPQIASALLSAGMAPQTPVAAVQDATLPQQRMLLTCLADAPGVIAQNEIKSPSILVIGAVAAQAATGALTMQAQTPSPFLVAG